MRTYWQFPLLNRVCVCQRVKKVEIFFVKSFKMPEKYAKMSFCISSEK